MTDVIVVGGGLTGICTAAEIARFGLDVLLLGQGGVPGAGLPPLATVDPEDEEHADAWRLSGSGFLLDREPVPVLRDGVERGRVCRVDPQGLAGAWTSEALRHGVVVRLATPVIGVVQFGGTVSAVQTTGGTFDARFVVLVAGLRGPRFLAGTPGDILLGTRTRRWWLLAPGAESVPRDAVIEHADGWATCDLVGRVYVERDASEPGHDGVILDSGSVTTTTTPDGDPLVIAPQWVSGAVIACAGASGVAASLAVARRVRELVTSS